MKKLIIIFVIFLAGFTSANAQTILRPSIAPARLEDLIGLNLVFPDSCGNVPPVDSFEYFSNLASAYHGLIGIKGNMCAKESDSQKKFSGDYAELTDYALKEQLYKLAPLIYSHRH